MYEVVCLVMNGCARLIAVLLFVYSNALLKATLHTLKCLGKHAKTSPLLKQTLGQNLSCVPPIFGNGRACFCFSGDSLLPNMCMLWFGFPSLPLVLCLLGRPGFAALILRPTSGAKDEEGSFSSFLPWMHRAVLYPLTGILPPTFRFCYRLLLHFSFSVTCK